MRGYGMTKNHNTLVSNISKPNENLQNTNNLKDKTVNEDNITLLISKKTKYLRRMFEILIDDFVGIMTHKQKAKFSERIIVNNETELRIIPLYNDLSS